MGGSLVEEGTRLDVDVAAVLGPGGVTDGASLHALHASATRAAMIQDSRRWSDEGREELGTMGGASRRADTRPKARCLRVGHGIHGEWDYGSLTQEGQTMRGAAAVPLPQHAAIPGRIRDEGA